MIRPGERPMAVEVTTDPDTKAQERKGATGERALAAERIAVGYGQRLAVDALSLAIERGTITALVGPNGSGKSTVLKALARILAPQSGAVYLDGQAIARMPTREVARRLAILPQGPTAPDELTVGELVEQGRYPHVGALRTLGERDFAAIEDALTQTHMTPMRHRRLDSLSGGERQRAWIALALAQATPVLLLDEPTTFLDIGHQLEVLDLIRDLKRARNMTLVLVLHDLNQAARYADRLLALQGGRIVADGTPAEILTPALLAEVFQVKAEVIRHPVDGFPLCLPYTTARPARPGTEPV
ncbi:MAG TPA: ABC transporter ATP-binding protein [Ktedonobacterales bacterium]